MLYFNSNSKITNIAKKRMKRERMNERKMKKKKMVKERCVLSYDISSWSKTERRNEMTLKAAFI